MFGQAEQTPSSALELAPERAPVCGMKKELGDFIEKEKAEVYLLLDFLSGRADKKIRDEKVRLHVHGSNPAGGETIVERSLIEAVCEARWPPVKGVEPPYAEVASLMLKARDRLSEIANPASGASIAFTTLTTNVLQTRLRGRRRLLRLGLAGASRSERAAAEDDGPINVAILENSMTAYPQYPSLAQSFNKRRQIVEFLLPAALTLTILMTAVSTYFHGWETGVHSDEPSWLLVLKYNCLPAMYGFIGACCGVLRTIQIKVRDCLLMPRDRTTIFMQLWFGVVMGFTIGLFRKTMNISEGLSFSALSFLAGLAADSFFSKLDDVLRTVFGAKSGSPGAN